MKRKNSFPKPAAPEGPSPISRRRFLQTGATAAAGVALPYFIPSGVLAAPGRPGANDRIVTGHIGTGGRGIGLLNQFKEQAGAVCDADRNHLAAAAKRVARPVRQYADYRELLEDRDVDAVVIATPDHWHALMTIHACEAGKDVYCEKPAAKTIAEGRAMVNTARRYGRVVQIGSQGRSHPDAYAACQFIRNGQLGRVSKVTCWHPMNPEGGFEPDSDPPAELDWDMWLGPARWVPYNPARAHRTFRYFLDFGGGVIRDRGAHIFSLAFWFLDADEKGPVTVEATGTAPAAGLYDCPTRMEVTYQFGNPDWTLVWSQPGEPAGQHKYGARYWGERDTLYVEGGDGHCHVEDKAKQFQAPARGPQIYRSADHIANWLECIRSRNRPIMDVEAGHRVASLCILGNLSYRLGRKLTWDSRRERFVNDAQANLLLSNPGRGQWHL